MSVFSFAHGQQNSLARLTIFETVIINVDKWTENQSFQYA